MSSKKRKVTTTADLIAQVHEDLRQAMAHFQSATENFKRAIAVKEFAQELQNKPVEKKPTKPAAKPVQKPAPKKPPKPAKPAKPAAAPTDMQTGKEPEKKGDDVVRGSSVRQSPHELTLNIGSQPVKELAEADAKDLLNNPKVFWYRPIQFPDPKRYQVQPRVIGAKVVERKDPKFTRAPWTVSATIEALGDDKRCASWLTGVLNKNKADQE